MTPSGLVCLAADKPGGWSLPEMSDRSDAPDQRHVRSYLQRHVTPSPDIEGGEYEIDLSTANATTLRDTLAAYIAAARRSGGRRASSTRPAPAAAASSAAPKRSREENQQIRAWAFEHGAFVPDRGRIPGLMVAAYEAGDPSMLSPRPPTAPSRRRRAQRAPRPPPIRPVPRAPRPSTHRSLTPASSRAGATG